MVSDPVLLLIMVKTTPVCNSEVFGKLTICVVVPVNTCVGVLVFVKSVVAAAVSVVVYPSTTKFPLAGKVMVVASVAVNVIGNAPTVVNESAVVIAFPSAMASVAEFAGAVIVTLLKTVDPSVNNVPLVGSVIPVEAVAVNVIGYSPTVVNESAVVIAFPSAMASVAEFAGAVIVTLLKTVEPSVNNVPLVGSVIPVEAVAVNVIGNAPAVVNESAVVIAFPSAIVIVAELAGAVIVTLLKTVEPSVNNVPLVGSVIPVEAVAVKVIGNAPDVVNESAVVIAFPSAIVIVAELVGAVIVTLLTVVASNPPIFKSSYVAFVKSTVFKI